MLTAGLAGPRFKRRNKLSVYKTGVDVSQWQGTINWEKAKTAGVQFAMIRAGFGQNNPDPQFERNITECNRLGIPCGIYWFSYAYTEAMAAKEAEYALAAVAKHTLEYPIAFDFEGDSADYALKKGVTVTKTMISAFARAFCGKVSAAKYSPMIYTNPDYLSRYYDAAIPKDYDIWLAQWPSKPDLNSKPALAGGLWQFTNSGSIDGITGRTDRNAAYIDYPVVLREKGLNGLNVTPTPTPTPEPSNEAELARKWVIQKGISDGENPDSPATRQQIWTMLYRMNGGK